MISKLFKMPALCFGDTFASGEMSIKFMARFGPQPAESLLLQASISPHKDNII